MALDSLSRKEIAQCLHKAIDNDISDDLEKAYHFYVEGVSLVAEVLKKDLPCEQSTLTLQDKWNLVKFAKQSLGRISLILGERDIDLTSDGTVEQIRLPMPTAPLEGGLKISSSQSAEPLITEQSIMMARYQHRLGLASSALDKQNVDFEMARKVLEKASITRTNLARATAWALQNAHKKFQIQEKLANGQLRESDLRKQQLYTVSLQFNEGNSWLSQLHEDLSVYPNNEKVARELLDVVLTDNSHPIKATINNMQEKIMDLTSDAMLISDQVIKENKFDSICKVVKEDISIINDVLKALFNALKIERNSVLTSEAVHHVYFSQIKPALISLIRAIHIDEIDTLQIKMKIGADQDVIHDWNECPNEAVSKLHYLRTLHSPYNMVDCSVHVIKLLVTCKFENEHSDSIGADDLLPRLCKVVLSSGLPAISAEAYFMEAFMPSEKALGEEGYAVTMLQSAIAHLTMA